jgi:hypothetical protein
MVFDLLRGCGREASAQLCVLFLVPLILAILEFRVNFVKVLVHFFHLSHR